jgi:hypothetical protein
MLDIKVFAKSIQQLGNYYPKFELTKEQMETWYKFFAKYTDNEFFQMIKLFIENNEFPPQSPRSLLKYYEEALKENFIKKYMTADEAWEVVKTGLRQFSLHHEHYQGNKLFEWLTQYPLIISDTVRQHLTELANLTVGDTFVGNAFKKTYNSLLEQEVTQQVKRQLQLTSSDTLMLESFKEG